MPSKSQAQHNFMAAAAHSKEFAKEHNISQSTAKEFIEADQHNPSYKDKPKVATEDKASVGETIGRVKEMAAENHIPAGRTQKIVKAAIAEVSEEDMGAEIVDENTDIQMVDEHNPHAKTTNWLEEMYNYNTDHPAGYREEATSVSTERKK